MNPLFLREAIRLSLENMEANAGGPFGAVIVRAGEIVGQGCNRVSATNDPTAHAEVMAIRDACTRLKAFRLEGCEIYSSCEPCPMCLAAIYWSRLHRVYYAASQADAETAGFDDAWLYREFALPAGKRAMPMTQGLGEEAAAVFKAWKNKEDRIGY